MKDTANYQLRGLFKVLIPVVVVSTMLALFIFASGTKAETYDETKVRPATFCEVESFLISDVTNDGTYDLIRYNCLNFAVDLWRNAYLNGLDAFLILINSSRWKTHVMVGFYFEDQGEDYTNYYWFSEEIGRYLLVEPDSDIIFIEPQYDGHTWICSSVGKGWSELGSYRCIPYETIAFFSGEDAFNLWQTISGGRSIIPLVRLYNTILTYKIGIR